jgi:hypothetical protein
MWLLPSLPGALPSSPPLSLSLSRVLPKGYVRARRHHRCMPLYCGVSGSRPKPSTSTISAGSGIRGSSWSPSVCEYMEVMHVVAPELLHQVLQWPWGRLCRLHQHRLCGSINPAFGLQGYVTEHQFTITASLVDRSLGNSWSHRNKILIICTEPQQPPLANSQGGGEKTRTHHTDLKTTRIGGETLPEPLPIAPSTPSSSTTWWRGSSLPPGIWGLWK